MQANLHYSVARAMCLTLSLLLLAAVPISALDMTWISDIHYDPLFGQEGGFGSCTTSSADPMGESGCDASLKLVESALADASTLLNAFTVFGGDWQRHQHNTTGLNVSEGLDAVATALANVHTAGLGSSEVNVTVTLGNIDLESDYEFDYSADTHPFLDEEVSVLESHKILTEAQGMQMRKCGFYTATSAEFSVISLNTLLWSSKIIPAVPDSVEDPCGQFAYLDSELSAIASSGHKAIILGHIPPIIDADSIVKNGSFDRGTEMLLWKAGYQTRYMKLLNKYKKTIVTHIYGHEHVFRVLALQGLEVPGFVMPSISTSSGNTPSYLVASFSSGWALQGVTQRYLQSKTTWTQGMSIAGAIGSRYGFANFTDLRRTLALLGTHDDTWANYLVLHSGGGEDPLAPFPNKECGDFCRSVLICTMLFNDLLSARSCAETVLDGGTAAVSYNVTTGQSILTALLLIFVSLFASGAILLKLYFPKLRRGEVEFIPDIDWGQQLIGRSFKKKKKKSPIAGGSTANDAEAAAPTVQVVDLDANAREEAYAIPETPVEVTFPSPAGDRWSDAEDTGEGVREQ